MASNKNCKVTNLSITRDGNKFKASWKKPSNWSKNWDWTDVEFWIDRANATPVQTDVYRAPSSGQKPVTYTGADRFWIKGSGFNDTSDSKNYDRKRYHPVALKKYCKKAWVGVHGGWNPSGKPTERGNKAWAEYNFKLPRVPSKKITYNNETGVFTVVVKTDPGKDQQERYDTRIKVALRKTNGKDVSLMSWTSTRSTEWKKTFKVSKYLTGMEAGKYIMLKVWAYSRGMAGDNPTASAAKPTTYKVVWPQAPTVKSVTLSGGLGAKGRIRINVSTGGDSKKVKVQRKVGSGSWTDVSGAVGNQSIPAYFDNYADIWPEKGVKVYYRTVATRENYTSYSVSKYAACLFTAVPTGTAIATIDTPTVSARSDGTSATVIMPWVDTDKNTGCELIYSLHSYFDSYTTETYTGKDKESKKADRTTKTATIYGLSPGKKYYFKFRRYREYNEEVYYSSWSGVGKIIMPDVTTDACAIKSTSSDNLGTRAFFTVVSKLKNILHHIGVEITYSESKDAWTSSSETPSSQIYNDVELVDITDPDWKDSWTQQVELILAGLSVGATYYMKARIFGTYNDEVIYSAYSSAVTVTMQSAENDKCSIAVSPLSGGTRAELLIEVDEDSTNSGTEIQWSTYENSWYSNESPSSIKADWPLESGKQTVYLSGLLPDTMYYVRARRYNDAGGNPGPWSEIVSFTTVRDTAANDSVGIVSAIPDASGTSAEVIIGWNEDNQNLATEISWSDNALAWVSNVSPSSMELNWDEDPESKSEDWSHTQTIQLRDLSLGTTYYIKARRKNEDESGTTWTPYSPMATVVMPTKSENVDVRCGIVLLESEPDGVSAKIIVGWDGDHAGCEVSWSDDPNAWESSSQPNSFEFDWSDSEPYPGHYESADGMVFDETIEFYSCSGSGTESDPYVYTKIDEPSSEGMYTYYLTSDTDISIGKSYYTRSGSGTDIDPYVYTLVTNPVAENIGEYYERTCNYFVLMDSWSNTSTCYIKGLEQGVLYYVKARSYGGGNEKTYSAYTEDRTVMPFGYPDSVILTVPAYVTRGNPIECWWDVASEMLPTEWHMHLAESPNVSIADGTGSLTHTILEPEQYGDGDAINLFVEAGCGGGLTSSGVVMVPIIDIPMCEAYGNNVITEQPANGFVVYTDNPISILYATCYSRGCTLAAPDGDRDQLEGDSVWTASLTPSWMETSWSETSEYSDIFDAYEDAVESYEDCKEAFDATPEAQTLAGMTEDDPGYSEAYDAAYSTPEGIALQDSEGVLDAAYNSYVSHSLFDLTSDTVIVVDKTYYTRSGSGTTTDPYIYESVVDPVVSELENYYEEESIYSANVEMPIVDLYDGGSYWCEFAVIEKTAGVPSDISTVEFSVEYAHQAPDIENYVTIIPDYEKRSVTINLGTPVGSVESDVYDIYRMTPKGFDLIREGVELGSSLEDLYAPFGHDELMYRVAIRTSDRDFAWLDFPYIMPVYVLRFDWKFGFAEYPWNVGIRENLAKSFESRMHVDGSVNGYWDKGVEHKGSFSTDVIRVDSWELIKNARDIGSYPGPIFVRDSYGKAMECNVEVSEISIPNLAKVVGISFDFTNIKLTDQFKPDNGSGGLPEDDEGD